MNPPAPVLPPITPYRRPPVQRFEIAGDVSRLDLGPNDSLLITVPDSYPMSDGIASEIRDAIRNNLGRPELKVLVLGGGLQATVLRAEEDA